MKFNIEDLKKLKEIVTHGIDEMYKRYELLEDKEAKARLKSTIIYSEDLAKDLQNEIDNHKK